MVVLSLYMSLIMPWGYQCGNVIIDDFRDILGFAEENGSFWELLTRLAHLSQIKEQYIVIISKLH